MERYIDWMRRAMRGRESYPAAETLGMKIVSVRRGRVVMEMLVDERHWNPMGTVHGGIFAELADAAMGSAFACTLDPGETSALFEIKMNFLRPVWKTRLTAVARVVKRGESLGLVECDVRDSRRRLVAKGLATCMILRGRAAAGRAFRARFRRRP